MSFSIDRYKENDLSLVRLQDKSTDTIVCILPEYGAMLHAFEVPFNGGRYNIIDNYASKAVLDAEYTTSYKSAKLSPFACRIPDGKYEFLQQTFEFAKKFKDGSAIHGLLFNKPFNITDEFADDNRATLLLRYQYKNEDKGYPHNYGCEVKYTLHPNRVLQVETIVRNLGNEDIPMVDGWHPYFQLGGSINDCELQFNSHQLLEFNDKLIPTGQLLEEPSFLQPALLGNRELDNCFLLDVQEQAPCCVLHHPANKLTLSIFSNAGYPYLQIYTPPHRNSIAIENLSGAPDAFNNGMGLMVLNPAQAASFNVWYQLGMG